MAGNFTTTSTVILNARAEGLTAAFKKAEKETDALRKKVKELDKGASKSAKGIRGSFQKAARSVAVLEGPLGGVAGRLNAVGAAVGAASPALVAFGIATAAITTALGLSVGAAIEYEKQMQTLEGVIIATGAASGYTASQLDGLAVSLGRKTLTSAVEAREAMALLAVQTTLTGDKFEKAARLAQDLSAVTGRSLTRSMQVLARALQDPEKNMETLVRLLPVLSGGFEDAVKSISATGDVLAAQDLILGKLGDTIGGIAETQATSLSGELDTLGENIKLLTTVLGIFLVKLFSLREIFGAINGTMSDFVDRNSLDVVTRFEAIGKAADEAKARMNAAADELAKLGLDPEVNNPATITLGGGFAAGGEYESAKAEFEQFEKDKLAIQEEYNTEVAARREAAAKAEQMAAIENWKKIQAVNLQNAIDAEMAQKKLDEKLQKEKDALNKKNRALARKHQQIILTDFEKFVEKRNEAERLMTDGFLSEQDFKNIEERYRRFYDIGNQTFNKLDEASIGWMDNFIDGLIDGETNFKEFANAILKDIARIAAKELLLKSFAGLQGEGGGIFSGIGKFFGIGENASGTKNFRGGLSIVGERGPELIHAPRGSRIDSDLSALGGGGSTTIVNVINNTNAQATTTETQVGNERMIEVMIENVVSSSINNNGAIGRSLTGSYGTRRRAVVR